MLALHRHIIVAFFRHFFRVVVDGGLLHVHVAVFEAEDPDVLHLWVSRLIIFVHTAIHASPASDTTLNIKAVPEQGSVYRRFGSYNKGLAVFSLVFCIQPLHCLVDFLFGHSLEMVLNEFLPRA